MVIMRIAGDKYAAYVDLEFECPLSKGNVRIATFKSIKEARQWVNKIYGYKPELRMIDDGEDD